MPRASLRSVFTFIAPSAALRCRVSIRIAASPAAASPACNHCDSGPASRPIRVNLRPPSANHAASASGSLATFASRTIFPVSSTTHTLLSSKDTSIPAKYSTAVPPRCLDAWGRPVRTPQHHQSEGQPPIPGSPLSWVAPLPHLSRDIRHADKVDAGELVLGAGSWAGRRADTGPVKAGFWLEFPLSRGIRRDRLFAQ